MVAAPTKSGGARLVVEEYEAPEIETPEEKLDRVRRIVEGVQSDD